MACKKTIITVFCMTGVTAGTLYGSYSSTMSPLNQPFSHTGNTPRTGSSLQAPWPDVDTTSIISGSESVEYEQQDQVRMASTAASHYETQAELTQPRLSRCNEMISRLGYEARRNMILCGVCTLAGGITFGVLYLVSKYT